MPQRGLSLSLVTSSSVPRAGLRSRHNMSNKPNFGSWHTLVSIFRSSLGLSTHHLVAEEQLGLEIRRNPALSPFRNDEISFSRLCTEHNWHVFGRPYFKVWPGIADALRNTSLNISCDAFQSPYECWELRLPRAIDLPIQNQTVLIAVNTRENGITRTAPAADFANREVKNNEERYRRIEGDGPAIKWSIMIWYAHQRDDPTLMTRAQYYIKEGQTLEEGFSDTKHDISGNILSSEEYKWLRKVVAGVCMFAIGKHELVLPDVKQPVIHAKPRGKKKQKAMEQLVRDKSDPKGWLVGSEIDLPRPLLIGEAYRTGNGDELTFGHVRSGHMRMQPCGPKSQDRKLIFVPPTIVRPDLPIRQTHGYRIRG